MMSLLNYYLPVFRFMAEFTLNPDEYSNYDLFRAKSMAILKSALLGSELTHQRQDCTDAYFAVIIWLDERVLCSPHEWVRQWRSELLQTHFFKTSVGGEVFFARLDSIDKMNTPLRMVFLFCLLMGFRGKYTWQDPVLLQKRIKEERKILPVEWRTWPNQAQLIKQQPQRNEGHLSGRKRFRQRKGFMLWIIAVIYLSMLLYGLEFVFKGLDYVL